MSMRRRVAGVIDKTGSSFLQHHLEEGQNKKSKTIGEHKRWIFLGRTSVFHYAHVLISRFGSTRKKRVATTLCLCTLVLYVAFRRVLFGPSYSVQGGLLGKLVDSSIRRCIYHQTLWRHQEALRELGIDLPPLLEPLKGNTPVLPQGTLAETLTRHVNKANLLTNLDKRGDEWEKLCLGHKKTTKGIGRKEPIRVPNVIFQPVQWLKPIRGITTPHHVLHFDEGEMQHFVSRYCSSMMKTYAGSSSRIYIWSLCALYQYGGWFVGGNVRDVAPILDSVGGEIHDMLQPKNGQENNCEALGAIMFGQSNQTKHVNNNLELLLLAFSPRHPYLKHAMENIKNVDNTPSSDIVLRFLDQEQWKDLERDGSKSFVYVPSPTEDGVIRDTGSRVYATLVILPVDTGVDLQHQPLTTTVTIKEASGTVTTPIKALKVPLTERMRLQGIAPGWVCMRCLRTRFYGSFSACNAVCPSKLKTFFCEYPTDPRRREVTVEVSVQPSSFPKRVGDNHKRIPRIVHQTWFEEVTAERYPHLVRLQNSWKQFGWDYRFYTEQSARDYIMEHYPTRFVDAFDALVPGAYRADLFRYLVLLKDGGVYADIDVKLDTNLDTFITPDMSFFVPRDLVVDYAIENFCLWNGLMGAAPGHLFLVRAVERLVSLILNRADVFDLEWDLCHYMDGTNKDMEVWKALVMPEVLLSGPCALGVSVNDVLSHGNSLARYNPGWLPPIKSSSRFGESNPDVGDAFILMADKADHGAFRFTDVERNIIVASTDLIGVSKTPLEITTRTENSKLRPTQAKNHYTTTTWHEEPWGTVGVYIDGMSNNEVVKLSVSYE